MSVSMRSSLLVSACAAFAACSSAPTNPGTSSGGSSSGSSSGAGGSSAGSSSGAGGTSFTLALSVSGSNGTVAATPTGPYATGTVVTVTAAPASGFEVASWTGVDTSSNPTSPIQHVTVQTNATVTVSFQPLPAGPFTLTLPAGTIPNGTLAITATSPTGQAGSSYSSGTVVTLTATPANGFSVASWTGDVDDTTSTATTNTVHMTANKTVGVNFDAATFAVTATATGPGTVAITSSNPSQTGTSFASGTQVTLTATPAQGFKVGAWTDSSTGTTDVVTVASANVTVNVTFVCAATCHTLTIQTAASDENFGYTTAVDSASSLVTGGNAIGQMTSTMTVPAGHTVLLTAHDTPSWGFTAWDNATLTTAGGCAGSVTVNADTTIIGHFPLTGASGAVPEHCHP